MSNWYEPVDDDATPDQVFFQEMERQRLLNRVGEANTPSVDAIGSGPMTGGTPRTSPTPSTPSALRSTGGSPSSPRFAGAPLPMATFPQPLMGGSGDGGSGMSAANAANGDPPPFRRRRVPTMEQIKIADATLSEYEMFKVADNWLNEELQEKMWEHGAAGDDSAKATQQQEPDSNSGSNELAEFEDDGQSEPWDDYGEESESKYVDYERRNVMEVPFPEPGMCIRICCCSC